MFIKRVMEFIASLLFFLISGLLYMLLSPVSYSPQGTTGAPDMLWTVLSAAFILLLPILFTQLGKRHCVGAYAAITVVLIHFIIAGLMGYLGYSHSFLVFIYPFYISIAPFVPLIESIIDTFSLTDASIYIMLIIPMIVYAFSMLAYLISHSGANSRALNNKYEQMRKQSHSYEE